MAATYALTKGIFLTRGDIIGLATVHHQDALPGVLVNCVVKVNEKVTKKSVASGPFSSGVSVGMITGFAFLPQVNGPTDGGVAATAARSSTGSDPQPPPRSLSSLHLIVDTFSGTTPAIVSLDRIWDPTGCEPMSGQGSAAPGPTLDSTTMTLTPLDFELLLRNIERTKHLPRAGGLQLPLSAEAVTVVCARLRRSAGGAPTTAPISVAGCSARHNGDGPATDPPAPQNGLLRQLIAEKAQLRRALRQRDAELDEVRQRCLALEASSSERADTAASDRSAREKALEDTVRQQHTQLAELRQQVATLSALLKQQTAALQILAAKQPPQQGSAPSS